MTDSEFLDELTVEVTAAKLVGEFRVEIGPVRRNRFYELAKQTDRVDQREQMLKVTNFERYIATARANVYLS